LLLGSIIEPCFTAGPFDAAVILVDRLQAMAALLSLEEVAEQFCDLSAIAEVSELP
jgi:hypothetical protein